MRTLIFPLSCALLLTTVLSPAGASAQDNAAQALPLVGSSGGTVFTRQCPAGQVLTGVRTRAGLVIDALGIKCRPVNANGTLGAETSVGTLAGGTGGTADSGSCPTGTVVSGQGGLRATPVGVSLFDLRCRRWDPASRSFVGGIVAVIHVMSGAGAVPIAISALAGQNLPASDCTRPRQPVVLLRGRSGGIVDAVGLTCNEP